MPLPKHFSGKEIELPPGKARGSDSSGRGAAKSFFASPILIGAIVVSLAVGAMYFLGSETMKNALFNKWVLIAVAAAFLVKSLESQKMKESLFFAVTVGALAAIAIFFLPVILNAATPYVPMAKQYAGQAELFLNPEKLIAQTLPPEILGKQTAETPSEKTFRVDFKTISSKAPLNVVANLQVLTNEDLVLKPICLLDGKQISSSPSSINVLQKSTEQSFSIACSGPVSGTDLVLKIEAPFKTRSTLQVAAGSGTSLGKRSSVMNHDNPYSLSLDLPEPQPLAKRDIPYPLYVSLFRKDSGVNLKSLNSLTLSTIGARYSISCNSPFEAKSISGLDRERLDSMISDRSRDLLTFICQLDVNSVPDEGYEGSTIYADADFVVEKEFKTRLA